MFILKRREHSTFPFTKLPFVHDATPHTAADLLFTRPVRISVGIMNENFCIRSTCLRHNAA